VICDFCDKFVVNPDGYSMLKIIESDFTIVDNWIVCDECMNKIKHLMKHNQEAKK
jgi:hypothetical protein